MYGIFDLHNDFLLKLASGGKKSKLLSSSGDALQKLVGVVWTSELQKEQAMQALKEAQSFVSKNEQVFLGVEDLHFLSKDILDEFALIRPLYAGLTWNSTNCLAGGAYESGRLTAFGRQVIRVLEAANIQIDLAHLNEESFADVAKFSGRRLFCSHTACAGLYSCPRNLKDYQIKTVVDSGGLVGICLVSEFLNGTRHADFGALVRHIDYFACKFGINNLALGTDFFGTKSLPRGVENYVQLKSKLSLALQKLGYTEKSIDKIMYLNAEEFFGKNA